VRLILITYTLRNGARGTLHCIASSTTEAVLLALDTFGNSLRTCAARAA
jgi:hypothetical protein